MIRLPLFVVWLAAVVLSPNLAHPAEPLEAPFGVKWGRQLMKSLQSA